MGVRADPAAFRERALARLRGEIVPTGPVHESGTALGRKRNRNTARNAQRTAALSPWKWRDAKKRFGDACAYCGAEKPLEREHFIPLALGGTLRAGNIVPACQLCNRRKRDTHPLAWLVEVYGLVVGMAVYGEIETWLASRR